MSTLSLRLPDSLHKKIKEFSKQEGISINQFITIAVSEKISAFPSARLSPSRAPSSAGSGRARGPLAQRLNEEVVSEPFLGDHCRPGRPLHLPRPGSAG